MAPDKDPGVLYDRCVEALKGFMGDLGFTDAVLGLSGGIDSSLVAVMAAEAVGAQHVHGVLLPGPYSSKDSIEDARQLAGNLGIETMTIPIKGAYSAFAEGYEAATGFPLEGVASENTQARCRMVYLMALSNANNWMMLNTGNRSEAAMGYSTLYGDTAGAFAPIGGLYKTQVFEVAEWKNSNALKNGEAAPIPENVLMKPPSAELSAGQTDEDAMGISYKLLDEILRMHLDEQMSFEEIVSGGFPAAQVEMVLKRYGSYTFKRASEPPFPEI